MSYTALPAGLMPSGLSRANTLLGFGENGEISLYVPDPGGSGSGGVSVLNYGPVGDGVTDAAAAIQQAIDTGRSVFFPKGDYRMLSGVTLQTRGQRLVFEPGARLIPTGSFDVITLTGGQSHMGISGMYLEGAGLTGGYAVAVRNAARVEIDDIIMGNPWNVLYVEQSNVCRLSRAWINNTRGTNAIRWYGDAGKRSDILYLSAVNISGNTTARPTGIDWDGNCNTLQVQGVTLVNCGYGVRVRNTAGAGAPSFGMFDDLEVDFPTQHAISLEAGSHYYFSPLLYVHGSTSGSGIFVGAGVTSNSVIIIGGKITSHARYGIENAVTVQATGGFFSGNTLGDVSGVSQTTSNRFAVDANFYLRMSGAIPTFNFDVNDYQQFDRAANSLGTIIGGTSRLTVTDTAMQVAVPLRLPGYTFAGLPSAATFTGHSVRVTDREQRTATSDGTAWQFDDTLRGTINVKDYGAVGNGVANDTVAIQAAIDAAKGSGTAGRGRMLVFPGPGPYLASNLVIDRPLWLEGGRVEIRQIAPATGALLTISCAHDGTDYQAAGSPDPKIVLRGLTLVGSGKTDPAGAECIKLINAAVNPLRPFVYLDQVTLTNCKTDGLGATSWSGAVVATSLFVFNVGNRGVNANSCVDWQFTNCLFGVATQDNVVLSGCGQFIFTACNFYSATRYNLNMFDAGSVGQNHFYGCSFDRAEQHGIFYDVRGGRTTFFTSCYFAVNSGLANNTYSDLYVATNVTFGLTLIGCRFQKSFPRDAARKTKLNIEFQGGASTLALAGLCDFEGADIRTTGVTNAAGQVQGMEAAASANGAAGVSIRAATQFTGLSLLAGDGTNVAILKGLTAANKSGLLQLFASDGTTVHTQLAASGSGFLTKINFPGPYANDAAAAAAGVLVGETYRVTATGAIVWRVA